jgi:hypothetical protein
MRAYYVRKQGYGNVNENNIFKFIQADSESWHKNSQDITFFFYFLIVSLVLKFLVSYNMRRYVINVLKFILIKRTTLFQIAA